MQNPINPTTPALTQFLQPPREFSVLPFWFWNDELTEAELLRQIADFEDHGVYGFVIHPRVGLPRIRQVLPVGKWLQRILSSPVVASVA
jgi:hypothetical protein